MAEDSMGKVENGTPASNSVQTFEQRRELNRQNGRPKAFDPEAAIEGANSALEPEAFDQLAQALERGFDIDREAAHKSADAYSKRYFEGPRGDRERVHGIVTGLIEMFPDELEEV